MGPEYPKAVYRDGGAEMIWGKPVQTSAVHSEDEERESLASGWRLSPVAAPKGDDGGGEAGGSPSKKRGRPPKVSEEQ